MIIPGARLVLGAAILATMSAVANGQAPSAAVPPSSPPAPVLAAPTTVFTAPEPTVIASGLTFAEGPLWHDGKLFICDLAGDTVFTISPCEDDPKTSEHESWGKPVVFRTPSARAAGSAVDATGRLHLAHFAGSVTRTESDGTITTIASTSKVNGEDTPLAKCNDLAIHPSGTVFFTDFGARSSNSKGLFRITPAGIVESLDTDYRAANGVALTPDGATLYVADYGKSVVLAYDINAEGAASGRRTFIDLSSHTEPGRTDGLKVHADGRVITTGPGGIWVAKPDGTLITRLPLEGGASNLCFGGPDGTLLFITSGDKVLSIGLRATDQALVPPPAQTPALPSKGG